MFKHRKTWYDAQNRLPPDNGERAGSSVFSSMGAFGRGRSESLGEREKRRLEHHRSARSERPSERGRDQTCLMYVSLLVLSLAAFIAMLGKRWLNRYLRNSWGTASGNVMVRGSSRCTSPPRVSW